MEHDHHVGAFLQGNSIACFLVPTVPNILAVANDLQRTILSETLRAAHSGILGAIIHHDKQIHGIRRYGLDGPLKGPFRIVCWKHADNFLAVLHYLNEMTSR